MKKWPIFDFFLRLWPYLYSKWGELGFSFRPHRGDLVMSLIFTLGSIVQTAFSVWTILWEMMSRLKEKYMCVLLYACILQKLVGWALGNANINYWQIFGVRVQGVLLDLSLTGPYTAVCAGILRLSISMGKQFSTDYLTTVGPIFMQLFY